METSKAGANGGEWPATGGASQGQQTAGHPFGPNVPAGLAAGGESKGATIGFNCRVTVKGGLSFRRIASLFGGQDGGGIHIGGPDNSQDKINDLTLELEGTITFNGDTVHFGGQAGDGPRVGNPQLNGANADPGFGGQDGGGIHIGGADQSGGSARPPAPTSQYDTPRSGDGYQGN